MSAQEFEKEVLEATKDGWLTETQRKALLRKFENLYSNAEDKKALDMQLRNSLRIMRNAIIHRTDVVQDLSFKLIQISKYEKFLEIVDKPKGILCYQCKTGLLSRESTSDWMQKKDYHFILEQIPAEVCKNPDCKEIIYSSDTVSKKQAIVQIVDEYVAKIQKTKPGKITDKKCPMCRSNSLQEEHKGAEYIFQQALYHLYIQGIPLKAYCEQCCYQELDPKTKEILDWLSTELGQRAIELLNVD
ncbi:MAG: YgiT-type zinc finger protein [Candidatus Heimdallarchaeaceae archaeon]